MYLYILFQALIRSISAPVNEVDSRPPSVFSMTQVEREKVRDSIMGGACTVCGFCDQNPSSACSHLHFLLYSIIMRPVITIINLDNTVIL